ncbi:hypothetical protein ZEAMMB73_Zm00001d053608 [Zea mays]|uniref:Uncharacterized protein n=1 Tax=Zea mays TaxID=4577 RepID=A0A1D6QQM7_MAIZE|nr:hypothetical protein ZEAMMB73_Zm00001d053608 [Zea mays]
MPSWGYGDMPTVAIWYRRRTPRRMTGGKRFGGGRVPTGTPSLAWSSVVIVASLLVGASIVHNIYKPDMTIPPVEGAAGGGGQES